MERRSLLEYMPNFLAWDQQTAYVHPRGYRTVRWSYRKVIQTACRFARELELRGISQSERVLVWAPN